MQAVFCKPPVFYRAAGEAPESMKSMYMRIRMYRISERPEPVLFMPSTSPIVNQV